MFDQTMIFFRLCSSDKFNFLLTWNVKKKNNDFFSVGQKEKKKYLNANQCVFPDIRVKPIFDQVKA